MDNVIEDIQKACRGLFTNPVYFKKVYRSFMIEGNSPAIDRHNGFNEAINAFHWFENYYIYIKINFLPQPIDTKFPKGFDKQKYMSSLRERFIEVNHEFFNIGLSISIFQGGYQANDKKQLFRAEWDNYENNPVHPQPHWHFYPEDISRADFEDPEEFDFIGVETEPQVDLRRVHFAINGQWGQGDNFIHRITSRELLVRWFIGILSHIKSQLAESKKVRI